MIGRIDMICLYVCFDLLCFTGKTRKSHVLPGKPDADQIRQISLLAVAVAHTDTSAHPLFLLAS